MAKTGRPSIFTEEVAETLLDRLASGESLVKICADPKLPSVRTVLRWAGENEAFGTEYARAREAQAEFMDDLIVETAKKAGEDPQGARVKVDAYKWRAAKLAPKKYGDAMLHKHGDADGEKLVIDDVSRVTRITAILAKAREMGDD
jgi:hypothetical protein